MSVLAPEVLEALEADSFWCLSKLLDGIQDNYIFAQPGIQRLVKKMETLCGRVDGASDCSRPFWRALSSFATGTGILMPRLPRAVVGHTAPLAAHLKEQGVEFIQFAFRWMNCLLMRELSVKNIVRMWDTYLVSWLQLEPVPMSSRPNQFLSRRSRHVHSGERTHLLYRLASQAEGGDAFSEFHLYVCLAFLVRWSDQLREMDFQVCHPLCSTVRGSVCVVRS